MKRNILLFFFNFLLIIFRPAQAADGNYQGFQYITPKTAEEAELAREYVHEDVLNEYMQNNCQSEDASGCQDRGEEVSVFGTNTDNMIEGVSKLYSMFLGKSAMEGVDSAKELKKNGEAPAGESAWCDFIPPAVEAVAFFQVNTSNEKIMSDFSDEQNAIDRQKESLKSLERSHRERAKTANLQFMGWTGAAACYVVTATQSALYEAPTQNTQEQSVSTNPTADDEIFFDSSEDTAEVTNPQDIDKKVNNGKDPGDKGSFAKGPSTYLKIGAATALAIFYKGKADKHLEYADKIKQIAAGLPSEGDCNPITQPHCYCTQPSTMNDPKYCLPKPFAPRGQYAITCVDKQMKNDPACNCVKTDSCIDAKVHELAAGFNFGRNLMSSGLKPMTHFTRGRLTPGSIANMEQKLGAIKGKLKDYEDKVPGAGNLSKTEKGYARTLNGMGIPGSMAANLAKLPPSARGVALTSSGLGKDAMDGMSPSAREAIAGVGGADSKLLYFDNPSARRASQRNKDDLSFLKNKGRAPSGQVLGFYGRAQKAAEINKNTNNNIFDIISHRYRSSGWNRLETELKTKP